MSDQAETMLIEQVRQGDEEAWSHLIGLYEGRLLNFAAGRLGDRSKAEDIVQDTFVGFLTSLPNYDPQKTPVEAFLFSICVHKLTDALRKSGRRPTVSMSAASSSSGEYDARGPDRRASSLFRSKEQRETEDQLVADCLGAQIQQWKADGQWERVKCLELLWVLGWTNKKVAARLDISEQSVANHKSYATRRLRELIGQRMSDEDLDNLGL